MAVDYEGVLILDTKTNKTKNIKTLFKKQRVYSEVFKEYFDNTKSTSIYRMVFYRDKLIFSEVNQKQNYIYIYSLKKNKIIKTYKHHKGDITSMFIQNSTLFGLSCDGYIYKWDF